jgi:hypothetical protein
MNILITSIIYGHILKFVNDVYVIYRRKNYLRICLLNPPFLMLLY